MSLREYLVGAAFFTITAGGSLGAAGLLVRRRLGYMRPLARLLAFAVIGTGALVYAEVVPAALGVLSRPAAAVAALLWLALAALVRPATAGDRDPPRRVAPSGRISIAVAVVAVGAMTVFELARLRYLATSLPTYIDMLSFHLPGVARFIQSRTIWQVDQFLPGFATAQYPNNGDFLLLAAVAPWRDLAFVRFVPAPFLALTGIGTYALALELGAPRAAGATFGAAASAAPCFAPLALEGMPDDVSLAMLACGCVFLLRYVRARAIPDLVVCGIALGLGLGTKWYGATSTAVIAGVWALGQLASPARRRLLAELAALLALIAVGGGLWLVRNLVESGNPIYPKQVSLLGAHLFSGSTGDVIDRYGYTISDYLTNGHVLRRYVVPGFEHQLGLLAIVLAAGVVAAVVTALVAAARARGMTVPPLAVLATALVVLGICAEYLITPGSAYGPRGQPVEAAVNIRWLMPAVVLAAALSAASVPALGRWGPALEVAGLAAVIDDLHLSAAAPRGVVVASAGIAIALAAAAWRYRKPLLRARRRLRGRGVAASAGALVVLAVALGRADETRFDARSYAGYDPTLAWIDRYARAGHRIALAGAWDTNGLAPTLPAFGPRLGNYVAYVGDRVRASLHFPATAADFASKLRRGRYDLVLIGLQDPAHTNVWALRAGFRPVAYSSRLALYASSRAAAASRAPTGR